MQEERTLVRNRTGLRWAGFTLAAVLGLLIPSLNLPQAITGTLVNALLLVAALSLGRKAAVAVGVITPLSAALRGVLPLPLAVMIPFIALGNATLIVLFMALQGRQRGLAVIAAAVAKFALLSAAVAALTAWPLTLGTGANAHTVVLPAAMAAMMGWPQLATALAGGLLALGGTWGWARLRR